MKLVAGVVMAVGVVACGGDKKPAPTDSTPVTETPRILLPPVDSAQVTITANCRGASGISVDVDKWVVHLDSAGALSFVVLDSSTAPNSQLDVEIKAARRQGATWPFQNGFPGKVPPGLGSAKGVGRANAGTNGQPARYAIDVTCGSGSNRQKVSIDPDIFVD